MEKRIITETVFRKEDDHNPITFGEIDVALLPNDVILAGHDEGFWSENNSWNPFYYLEVQRERLETDQEFEKRKENSEWHKRDMEKRRYETYLTLKKEFENGQ